MTVTRSDSVAPDGHEPQAEPSAPDITAEWADTELAVAALDLLAHWWSRPDPEEFLVWESAGETAARLYRHYSPSRHAPDTLARTVADLSVLVGEYERLFVGPAPVPCPPYESFWRDDVPVEVRRALMGPCTTDLRRLYRELGLQLSRKSGELPDHIAVELEALAYALSVEENGPIAKQLFFEHVSRWLPRLCRAVSEETEHEVYRELAEISLEWLLQIERHLSSLQQEEGGQPVE